MRFCVRLLIGAILAAAAGCGGSGPAYAPVSGTVTLRLRHVPWDQAMDVIARARGLVYEREGNVILVRAAEPHR